MDWLKICTNFYRPGVPGFYDNTSLKVFVVKGKITAQQYKDITTIDYVA